MIISPWSVYVNKTNAGISCYQALLRPVKRRVRNSIRPGKTFALVIHGPRVKEAQTNHSCTRKSKNPAIMGKQGGWEGFLNIRLRPNVLAKDNSCLRQKETKGVCQWKIFYFSIKLNGWRRRSKTRRRPSRISGADKKDRQSRSRPFRFFHAGASTLGAARRS